MNYNRNEVIGLSSHGGIECQLWYLSVPARKDHVSYETCSRYNYTEYNLFSTMPNIRILLALSDYKHFVPARVVESKQTPQLIDVQQK